MNHRAKLIFLGLFTVACDREPEMAANVNGIQTGAKRPPPYPSSRTLIPFLQKTQDPLLLRKHPGRV